MGKRQKCPMEVESNSGSASSTDDTSSHKPKSRKRRSRSSINASKTKAKDIMKMLAQLNDQMGNLIESQSGQSKEMEKLIESQSGQSKVLEKLIESQNVQSKELEKLIESQNGQSKELGKLTASIMKQLEFHTSITGHPESDAPRSQMNQVQTPRYRLVFKSAPSDKIEKGKTIEISVALVEGSNDQPVQNGPLASAKVELVVVKAEFNQHDNQYNWSREDFERNIIKPRRGNSATEGANQSAYSIVSNGRFNLDQGASCYSGSAIFENSQNRKVRLGVMVVTPTEGRVLEGLSEPLMVRDRVQSGIQSNLHPNSSSGQRSNIRGGQSLLPILRSSNILSTEPFTSQEQQSSIQQYQSPRVPMVAQATYNQNGLNIHGGQSLLPILGNSNILSTEPFTSQEQQYSIQQYQSPHVPMVAQATYNQNDELASASNYPVVDPNFMVNDHVLGQAIDMPYQRIMPLQLVWNVLDQLMPLPKFNNCGLPTKCLMQVTMDELVTGPPLYTLKNRASSYRYNVMKGMEDVLDDGTFLHDIADAVEDQADGKLKEIDERRCRYELDDRVAVPVATPAAALAGFLVCPIIKVVVDKAKSCASDRMKWLGDGVPKALELLGSTLYELRAVAGAVQRRGSPDSSGDLRAWLQQLMDAVYEADDVLDDFDDSVPPPESSVVRLGKRLFGVDQSVNRLKDVVEKLVAIHSGCWALLAATENIASTSMAREPSGSYCPRGSGSATGAMRHHEDAVFGREKELREMVSWLVGASDADAKSGSVPIVSIVGLGGMGKTTLAQLLFNHPEVVSTFDLKIWVHPATMDNELELAKQILQSADVDVPDGMKSFDWLKTKLAEKISSRKFLLVIDDVWNREDMEEIGYRDMWSKVLAPLSEGNTTGSKIVVTTRQKIVARSLRASREVHLGDLPTNDIWSLFTKYAFGDEDINKQPPALQAIGRKIADKFRGSPLTAKAVGQMLEGRRSVTHWTKVLEMDGFDDVSKTLELCYQSLPEHLQPCFAICSLFPKNWRFKRDKLVKIWMALDFIQADSGCGETRLEDLGSKYFDQLVDRGFFHRQKVGGGRSYYYIHDLMHDLADKVSRFDCLRVEDAKKEIPKTIRHLSVSSDIVVQLKGRCHLRRLRTLLILKNPSSSLDQLPGDLFMELKGLRVLGLEGCNIVCLSEKIANLKYLRYLALCKSITRLPRAVTKLYRLQTFSSPKGSDLEVPADIMNLKRLRHLDMDTSKITGIGKLVQLQGSVKFHVKNEKGHTLGDLDGMSGLRKELHIKNLDVVKDKEEACQAGIRKKENVKVLELEWNSTGKSVPSGAADVLDGLEPNQYVKKLIIRRYHGNRSPSWLSGSLKASDFYIKYLHLINCTKWEAMPPLGQLPCLKVLQMKEMCSVKRISCDFYGTKSTAFPSLEELEFDDMPQWVEWTQEEKNIEVFPRLLKLRLLNCPELIKVPHLPLSVRNVSVKNTGFVSEMKLSSSPSNECKFALDTCSATVLTNGLMMHQQQVEAISILTLRNCEDVKFEELQVLTYLKGLQISHSSINDEQLGTCLRGLQALTWLEISNCNNITCLPWMENSECLTKFHELHIQHCSEVSSLHSLPSFAALESILIENCSKVTKESFPTNFNNSSLKRLSIMNCAELESLPSDFPSSLQVLHLIGCKPTLMTKLQLKDGPEWDKIASIPFKQIR